MKAFKQIDLKNERRVLWTYSTVLSLFCFIILISPAFAQQDNTIEDKPQLRQDFNEQDVLGSNDSVYFWHWNGQRFCNFSKDSLAARFHNHIDIINKQIEDIENVDSLYYSKWLNFWDNDFAEIYRNFKWSDTTGKIYQYWNDRFNEQTEIGKYIPDKHALEKMQKQNKEFIERFRDYNKEHQKLLEKYFFDDWDKNGETNADINTETDINKSN